MGSTGEPDRKRRHFSSISPTAATAKKNPFFPSSEEKKVWFFYIFYFNHRFYVWFVINLINFVGVLPKHEILVFVEWIY